MASIKIYTPGRPPQYGKDRWRRYEDLRVSGFTKEEARELSRIDHPDDKEILKSMVDQRKRLMSGFVKEAEKRKWTPSQQRYYFYKGIRNWYGKKSYTKKKDPVWSWYNQVENKLARTRGWRKGQYDPEAPDEPRVRRRGKIKTPEKRGSGKGQIKAQQQRARARKKATKQMKFDKVPLKQLLDMRRDTKEEFKTQPLLQKQAVNMINERIRFARAERDAGRDALG